MLMLPPFAAGFFGANVLVLGCVGASFEGTLAPRWLLLLMGGGLVGPRPLRGAALFERGMDAVRCCGGQKRRSPACKIEVCTLFTPTLLARLPPIGAFLMFPAGGALWRRFLPKISWASCSCLRCLRPWMLLAACLSRCGACLHTSLDDVVEGNRLLLAVDHCDVLLDEGRD